MKRVFAILSLLLTMSCGNAQVINHAPATVIIAGGQSNALGYDPLVTDNRFELPSGYWKRSHVYTFNGNSFVDLDVALGNNQQPSSDSYGSWSFITPLVFDIQTYTGGDVYLIQYTRGGSILYDTAWLPGRCWGIHQRGNCFDSMVYRINYALDLLNRNGIGYNVAGFLWQQGESDGSQLIYAQRYDNSLYNFIDSLRIATNLPNLHCYVGTASNNCTAGYCPYFRDTVRSRQNRLAAQDSTITLIECNNLEFFFDHLHFTADSHLKLSKLYLNAIKNKLFVQSIHF